MTVPSPFNAGEPSTPADSIRLDLANLKSARTTGELRPLIASVVLRYSPNDIQQMRRNFREKSRDVSPEYRDRLEAKITEHLVGAWQTIRLMQQQGAFSPMKEPVPVAANAYWEMAAVQCKGEGDDLRLRFLKFLIVAFCMFVQHEPGHPAGTPFPGGDTVQYIDGRYYCPVKEKASDVDAALCPFCPALQTPVIGSLIPPHTRNRSL
ncbi:MAG: DUF2115 domain-containing protein [Methanoregula sp.]